MKLFTLFTLLLILLYRLDAQNRLAMPKQAAIFTTAMGTDYRITPTDTLVFTPMDQPLETQPCVFVDPQKTFQTFLGIGAAITDAAAETFAKMPADKQTAILKAFYDSKEGIGYSLARTNIHSCDFSSGSYTYVQENDKLLQSFSVAHDEQYRIPMIQRAIRQAGGKLTLFASPWSPPAWMKDNNHMLQGGKLKPEYFQTWADYFVKFIKAYENKGIPIWGVTVQNEPMAKQKWESCIFTAEEERDFIKNYLGPTLARNGLKNKKIVAWDHNRDLIYQRANTLLSDPKAAQYIYAIGFHWYEDWTGGATHANVKLVTDAFPQKHVMLTEACNGPFDWNTMNDWTWGERYAQSMIHDFNNGSIAWTDWNVILDEIGGPNHVGNYCFAPMHADTRDGSLHFNFAYYCIGHFSKFIRPGARRITASPSRAELKATAFKNVDGSVAVIVLNDSDKKIDYRLYVGNQAITASLLPKSIATIVF